MRMKYGPECDWNVAPTVKNTMNNLVIVKHSQTCCLNVTSNLKSIINGVIITVPMIHAEISIYPMATSTASVGFYIAKAIESVRGMDGLRYEINPMGTVLESRTIRTIHDATDKMMETVHNLGISRVEVVLKIDSRRDRDVGMEEKLDSVKKHMR